jgi:asparagine synthetase B (glutamine-hydrolysing)
VSYFIVGRKGITDLQSHSEKIFDRSVYTSEAQKLVINSAQAFVYCYSTKKVIDDVLIESNVSDSWILLVGAPVLNIKTDEGKQKFSEEFFSNPKKVLKSQVDGHFAIVAYDSSKKVFLAASDWHNTIPIYLAISKDGPLFCSAELPIARFLQCQPDEFGFAQSIHFGAVWGSRTRFNGISKLEPCEFVRVDAGNNISREKYWYPQEEELWEGSFDEVSHRWINVMQDTIRTFTDYQSRGGISSDLTGGEDSRLIVALLHSLGLAFCARVAGEPNDTDIVISRKVAEIINLKLSVEHYRSATSEDLSCHTKDIVIATDAYGSFFSNIASIIHEKHYPPLEYKNIHLCGLPGGGEFRGEYYPRALLLFPSISKKFDYRAFTRRKFLLDFSRNLLKMDDDDYIEKVYDEMKDALKEVEGFPAGTQVDHLIRVRQDCLMTLNFKRPFYYAFALRDMTRSTYNVPPHMKKGGRQFKAITEKLYPELARIKTQAGVPTIRKTLLRFPLFIPEYYTLLKKAFKGMVRQVLKTTVLIDQRSETVRHHALASHSETIKWVFENEPYSSWFRSADSMLSGHHYNPIALNKLLKQARQPEFDRVQLFGRIVNQEIAYHYVYDSM